MIFLPSFTFAQQSAENSSDSNNQKVEPARNFNNSPVSILDEVNRKANKDYSNEVQNTDLDSVTSKACAELWTDSRFSISRTLCYLKSSQWIGDYLQYVLYIWLTAATIILIRNGFQLVVASDKWAQIKTFKKNLINIIIWVVLLTGFYYLIDIFVSVVNLITE